MLSPLQALNEQTVRIGELTTGFYLKSFAFTVITCSWVLWNREAQAFVLRQMGWRRPARTAAVTPEAGPSRTIPKVARS